MYSLTKSSLFSQTNCHSKDNHNAILKEREEEMGEKEGGRREEREGGRKKERFVVMLFVLEIMT